VHDRGRQRRTVKDSAIQSRTVLDSAGISRNVDLIPNTTMSCKASKMKTQVFTFFPRLLPIKKYTFLAVNAKIR
jgi:hypothetical protein